MNPVLRAENLGRSFQGRPVLEGVSFQLAPGERAALSGANGSGKTTLLRILATLTLPSKGDAWIAGNSVASAPKRGRCLVGWAPATDGGFHARFTGRENLRFFGALHGRSRAAVDAFIADWRDWKPFALALDTQFYQSSMGMRQALLLARSLVHAPEILLWDEPFRSLDAEATHFLREKMDRDHAGKALLFSVHSSPEALRWATRELRLESGGLRDVRTP